MSYLYDLEPRHLPALLSGELAQIPDPETPPTPGNIPFDPGKRTILIGLGGTGVKIIDTIKGEMQKRFQYGWQQHVSFLAVDTDDWDLRDARNLTREECVCAIRPGIHNTVVQGYHAYPKAWRRFVDEDQAHMIVGFPPMPAHRKRLIGRMRLHYKFPGDRGVDEEIVDKLREQKCNVLMPFPPYLADHYDVYVIGGLSGGTGSGMLMDFPALIRHAFGPRDQVMIHAVVTLPDTMAALDPDRADDMNANGYAALKELEYYQQLHNRPGQPELFPYNDPAVDALQIPGGESPFATVTLLGSPNGPSSDAAKIARETAVSTILARLEGYPGNGISFSTRQNDLLSHWATIHPEEHFRAAYGTMGHARAAVPQDLLRAYVMGQLSKKAGFLPVSENEYMAMLVGGQNLLPFRRENHYDNAQDVTTQARQLLQPLIQFMQTYQKPGFSYEKVFGKKPTWEEIRNGDANGPYVQMRTQHEIARLTGSEEAHRLEDAVKELFQQFRQAVMQYVDQYGPFAFVNLFRGNGTSNPDGQWPVGIEELLCYLRDDLRLGRYPNIWPMPEDMEAELARRTREIQSAPCGVMAMMHRAMGLHEEPAARWVQAYDHFANARINQIRRQIVLGTVGILSRCFLEPARQLTQQLYTFGKVLETMSGIYRSHGDALTQFGAVQNLPLGANGVNIAGLFPGIQDGIRRELDRFVDSHNPWAIRQTVVQDFFQNPHQWLELDDNNLERRGGGMYLSLRNPWHPIPARRKFDRLLKHQMAPVPEFTLDELYRFAATQGITERQFAHTLLTGLTQRGIPRVNAHPGNFRSEDLTYPNGLHQSNLTLLAALQQEVSQNFHSIHLFPSHDSQSLGLYRTDYGFAAADLADLPRWEQDYESHLHEINNGLHSMSPDVRVFTDELGCVRYEEKTPWANYPGLVRHQNPMAPDPVTGRICRDGRIMKTVMQMVDAARKAGVLYEETPCGETVIHQVYLDNSINWRFDPDQLEPDPETGLLPEGTELLKQICAQNHKTLSNVTQALHFELYRDPTLVHPEDEWTLICRMLWYDQPLLAQIRDTLERLKPWYEDIFPPEPAPHLSPNLMFMMMSTDLLHTDDHGRWVLEQPDGSNRIIADLSPKRLKLICYKCPREGALVEGGMVLFYLYQKLGEQLEQDDWALVHAQITAILNGRRDETDDTFVHAKSLIKQELAVLEELGFDPNRDYPNRKFVTNLAELGITSRHLPEELWGFYRRLSIRI